MAKPVSLICAFCSTPFFRPFWLHQRWLATGAQNTFCTTACSNAFKHKMGAFEAECSVCQRKFMKQNTRANKNRKYFCEECHGKKVTLTCAYCGKTTERFASMVRFRGDDVQWYCDKECKNKAQLVPWENLCRSMLKPRWIAEFGVEDLYCRRCGHDKPYNIQIHHKIYFKNGGTNHLSNLEPLCRNCHGTEHYDQGSDDDED